MARRSAIPVEMRKVHERFERWRKSHSGAYRFRRVVEPADVAALAVHIMTNTALTGATYDIGGQQLIAA